jgi:hypothetical protein
MERGMRLELATSTLIMRKLFKVLAPAVVSGVISGEH